MEFVEIIESHQTQTQQCTIDDLVFFKTLRTTGLPVRNTPLINIPKGFSTEMTLEVA